MTHVVLGLSCGLAPSLLITSHRVLTSVPILYGGSNQAVCVESTWTVRKHHANFRAPATHGSTIQCTVACSLGAGWPCSPCAPSFHTYLEPLQGGTQGSGAGDRGGHRRDNGSGR